VKVDNPWVVTKGSSPGDDYDYWDIILPVITALGSLSYWDSNYEVQITGPLRLNNENGVEKQTDKNRRNEVYQVLTSLVKK
jgi:hypothetical protein